MAYSVSPVLAIVFKYCSKTGGISPFFFSKSVNKMNSVKMLKKLGSDNCLKLIWQQHKYMKLTVQSV